MEKATIAVLYARTRESDLDAAERWRQFRLGRDHLFQTHPQSPLSAAQQAYFAGLPYYDYTPALRFVLAVDTPAGCSRERSAA
jgi:hypothetical protein